MLLNDSSQNEHQEPQTHRQIALHKNKRQGRASQHRQQVHELRVQGVQALVDTGSRK